jgi:multiple sugar transport system permease protein
MMMKDNLNVRLFKGFIYIFCIFFAVLSIFPFMVMFISATRSTDEIRRTTVTIIPSVYFSSNFKILMRGSLDPWVGFVNSCIISVGATSLATYFSSLTAYALVAYSWKLRQPFFTFILAVMMIPGQVTTIGFYQFMYRINLTNTFWPLLLPAIASPGNVFFMRQYLVATLSSDIVNSARIDGAGELRIFNTIVLPIMKPAIATQAIFVFVGSWNNYFMPLILLTKKELYTMPIMVSLLRGDFYRTELGAVYLALALSVIPLFVVYFSLSRYIIAGVQLGGVKE